MLTRLTSAAAIVVLSASPAMAQYSPNSADLDRRLASLVTQAFKDCGEIHRLDAKRRADACDVAFAELARQRADPKTTSVGQIASIDFVTAVMQASQAAAYIDTDKGLSARVCSLMESSWGISLKLRLIPRNATSAGQYEAFQNPPANLVDVIRTCRTSYPPPVGAQPLPGT